MLSIIRLQLVWCGLIIAVPLDRFEGDSCNLSDGVSVGVCQFATACPSLRSIPKKDWITCSFMLDHPIVCCPVKESKMSLPVTQTRISSKSELKCATFPETSDAAEHIIGGTYATADDFPYIAALGYFQNPSFRCGASLISYQYLLTAAHCLIPEEPTFARLGVSDLFNENKNDPPVDVAIASVFIHPNYTSRPLRNDIALLKLNRTINETFLIPACLYSNPADPEPDVNLIIAGWGSTDPNDFELSPVLLRANVSTLDRVACNNTLSQDKSRRSAGELQTTQLCALGRSAQNDSRADTCVGDSGGPLELTRDRRRYIVGVTSNGKLCGSRWPGVYSRVAYYLDWIESVVWRDD